MKRKFLASLLALCMVLTVVPTAWAYDDTEGHWAEEAIDVWSGYGVLQGDLTGFRPNDSITRGEMAVLLVRLLGLTETAAVQFADVSPADWYADAIAKCAAAGILKGDNGMARPKDTITRQEAMVMLGRALGIREESRGSETYLDGALVADWAAGYVNALTNRGIVGGVGDNQLAPGAEINRASVVTVLNNAITTYANKAGETVTVSGDGITLVAAAGVTLTGETDGDVLIAAGAADGAVVLEDLAVGGTVSVTVPAEVTVSGSSAVAEIAVDAAAQVVVEEKAAADTITVTAPKAEITVEGEVAAVETAAGADQATVTVTETGKVEEIAVSADDVAVVVEGKVSEVTTEAAGTDVSGSGKVESVTAQAGASDVTVSTPKTEITVSKDADSGVTVNKTEVKPGESGTTNSKGDNVVTDKGDKPSSGGSITPSYDYYTVTFVDGDTVLDSVRVREGRLVERPADPVKDGYTFGGWYNGELPYNFDTPVEGKLTLTARWVAKPQTITLACTDTSVAPKTHVVGYGTVLTQAELDSVVAVAGYHVTSWTRDGAAYDFATVVTGDMTLTYTLQPNTYTVTFDIADAAPESKSVVYGAALTDLPQCTDADFTWTWYADAQFTEKVPATMPAKDLTLYGQWSHTASGLKGQGTESDPFLIGSGEDYLAIKYLSKDMFDGTGYFFEQTDNITVSGIVTIFRGTYNGGGYSVTPADTVTRNSLYLFAYVLGSTKIYNVEMLSTPKVGMCVTCDPWFVQDLTVSGITTDVAGGNELTIDQGNWSSLVQGSLFDARNYIDQGTPYAKKIFGRDLISEDKTGTQSITIENCTTNVNVNNSAHSTGAFIGSGIDFDPEEFYVTIRNCTNNGDITGGSYAGLFTGNPSYNSSVKEENADYITIESIENNGTIVATKANYFSDNGQHFWMNDKFGVNFVTGNGTISNKDNVLLDADLSLYQTDNGEFLVKGGESAYEYKVAFSVYSIGVEGGEMNSRNVLIDLSAYTEGDGTLVSTGKVHAYDTVTAIGQGIITEGTELNYQYTCENFPVAIVIAEKGDVCLIFNSQDVVSVDSGVATYIYAYSGSKLVGTMRVNQQ